MSHCSCTHDGMTVQEPCLMHSAWMRDKIEIALKAQRRGLIAPRAVLSPHGILSDALQQLNDEHGVRVTEAHVHWISASSVGNPGGATVARITIDAAGLVSPKKTG